MPNLKYVWEKSKTAIPPVGIVAYYQYMPLLWNKKKIDKPTSWADYWKPGAKYGDKIKGHLLGHDPATNLLEVYSLIMAAKLKGGGDRTTWRRPGSCCKQQKAWRGAVIQTSAQAAPYFENDQVWLTPYWSARSGYYVANKLSAGLHHPARRARSAWPTCPRCRSVRQQEAGARVPELPAGPGRAARVLPRLLRQPRRGRTSRDWPAEFAATQITTEEKMAELDLPDSALIGAKRNEWVMRWQEIMAG